MCWHEVLRTWSERRFGTGEASFDKTREERRSTQLEQPDMYEENLALSQRLESNFYKILMSCQMKSRQSERNLKVTQGIPSERIYTWIRLVTCKVIYFDASPQSLCRGIPSPVSCHTSAFIRAPTATDSDGVVTRGCGTVGIIFSYLQEICFDRLRICGHYHLMYKHVGLSNLGNWHARVMQIYVTVPIIPKSSHCQMEK